MGNPAVELIFLAPELKLSRMSLSLALVVEQSDIAAGTKGFGSRAFNHHAGNLLVILKGIERTVDLAHHAKGQGIQRMGTIEHQMAA